jgi:hypothetical protein
VTTLHIREDGSNRHAPFGEEERREEKIEEGSVKLNWVEMEDGRGKKKTVRREE